MIEIILVQGFCSPETKILNFLMDSVFISYVDKILNITKQRAVLQFYGNIVSGFTVLL